MTEAEAISAALCIDDESIWEMATRAYDHPEQVTHDELRIMAAYLLCVMNVE